jgi:hypothetical protein
MNAANQLVGGASDDAEGADDFPAQGMLPPFPNPGNAEGLA